jgi:hypothetical protein
VPADMIELLAQQLTDSGTQWSLGKLDVTFTPDQGGSVFPATARGTSTALPSRKPRWRLTRATSRDGGAAEDSDHRQQDQRRDQPQRQSARRIEQRRRISR